jgi:hypothetical protein
MGTVDNFKYELFRAYPQIAPAALKLAEQYDLNLREIAESKCRRSSLEIEAVLAGLTRDGFEEVSKLLSSCDRWIGSSSWYMVRDFYGADSNRTRITVRDGKRTVERIRKRRLSTVDLEYSHGGKVVESIPCRFRVNSKLEEPVADAQVAQNADIMRYNTVRLSVRKEYRCASRNVNGIGWMYHLIQTWAAGSVEEAERDMKDRSPTSYAVECEITDLPSEDTLTTQEKLTVFTSMLLKVQDLIEHWRVTHDGDSYAGGGLFVISPPPASTDGDGEPSVKRRKQRPCH